MKCGDYSAANLENALLKSFDHFGGVDKFIQPGEAILLKPNLIAPPNGDNPTTDARLIEAMIRIVREADAVPVVGDSPAFGSARAVARAVGLSDVLERQDVQLVELSRNARFPNGVSITRTVREFDKIINLPKFKAHSQLRLTGATKNLFGLTQGKVKAWRHFIAGNDVDEFCLMILRIHELVKPAFTLVDAVDVMEESGPRGGATRRYGFIFSGVNCLSIDSVMSACVGVPIHEVPLLLAAEKHGHRGTSLDEIEIRGEAMEAAKIKDFASPETLKGISFSLNGVIRSWLRHLWVRHVVEKMR